MTTQITVSAVKMAELLAEAEKRGAVRALREAADIVTPGPGVVCRSPRDRDDQWRTMLRDRADRIEAAR